MEEVVDPSTENASGFEPVTVRQFTIFLENRVGRLTLLLRALEENTTVMAMAIEESADATLARVICASSDAGRDSLYSNGFSFGEVDVLIVGLPKSEPAPLLAICNLLLTAELSIHSAYPLLGCDLGPAIALYCDDSILASQLLMRKGYQIISESDFRKRG